MRQLYILIIFFTFLTTFGQTSISWTNLSGNWKVEKAINIRNGDTAASWTPDKDILYSFDSNLNFTNKTYADNTVLNGKYNIDKTKKKIWFSNIIQTTKFPGTSYKDFVSPVERTDLFISKLTADILVFYSKGCDETGSNNCFSYTYLRKIK